MVVKCAVAECHNNYDNTLPSSDNNGIRQVIFHKFPLNNPELLKIWVDFCVLIQAAATTVFARPIKLRNVALIFII
jgi:hypothetical protein